MRWLLTITEPFLREVRAQLAAGAPLLEFPLGMRRDADCCEFLAPVPAGLPAALLAHLPRLRVALVPEALRGITHLYWFGFPIPKDSVPRVDLALYADRGCSAAVLTSGRAWPLEQVLILGARCERWLPATAPPDLLGEVPQAGAFSRLSGALGGDQVLARLQALSTAVVGASRLGGPLALARARTGCRKVVLIDDDLLEDHHLDALDADPRSVGRAKVSAVGAHVRGHAPQCEVVEIQSGIEAPAALRQAARQELLISAPDRGVPRLMTSACAVAYHRVHLDVGTGVFREGEQFIAGADIRLLLPGQGCILCGGGVDLGQRHERDWRRERAGSLASLNGLAVAYASFLLERVAAPGGVERSVWIRLTLDGHAQPRVEQRPIARRPGCRLCALAGLGDAAWTAAGG